MEIKLSSSTRQYEHLYAFNFSTRVISCHCGWKQRARKGEGSEQAISTHRLHMTAAKKLEAQDVPNNP